MNWELRRDAERKWGLGRATPVLIKRRGRRKKKEEEEQRKINAR